MTNGKKHAIKTVNDNPDERNNMAPLIIPFNGKTPKIDPSCFIAPNAVIIGDVTIGRGSSIWFNCVLRGDVNSITIGTDTNIQDGTIVHTASARDGVLRGNPTVIGNNVTVGHMALVHACTVEDKALIGMKACIMDGTVVQEGAIVAAGSVVPAGKKIGSRQLWMGSPARFVRDLGDDEADLLKWMNDVYIGLTPIYKEV